MKNSYVNLSLVFGAILTSLVAFGQTKNQFVPNFVNPLQKKSNPFAQNTLAPQTNNNIGDEQNTVLKIKTENGSFYKNLEHNNLQTRDLIKDFDKMFDLNSSHSFQQISEKIDALGYTHTNFQHYFNGIPIEGNIIMLHSKNGIASSINGQVTNLLTLETIKLITDKDASTIAKNYVKVTNLINEYPIETVIISLPQQSGTSCKFAYKVRIDSYSPLIMCYVYVDAKNGEVLNKINLIAHADTPGTAQTLYSGNQPITCDSYTGAFRLRETGRKIETYNATSATGLTASGFTNSSDFTNTSSTWSGIPQLESFTISTVAQSWWYTAFADEIPDLYIKVKDGSNQVVYTSNYFNNTNPSLTFTNLNLLLTDAPYTIEVWDYDAIGGDDFGGSYNISITTGTQAWSGNGNNGTYVISSTGHPALDVHWGMEKTYDFYLSVFNRNSYDGNGSIIKQYLNPQLNTVQSVFGSSAGLPNNAFAAPAPYNLMVYGMGDGQYMNPLVGLDVEGHEYTHMVVANNGNGGLTYEGESGALNESFADIFGVCVEFYSGINADWLMGEDIMVTAPFLRSMSNPNGGDQPDTYNGLLWSNPNNLSNDQGGVHTNSGVQNFWFYLLSQGGSGTNDLANAYSVSGIGINQARQIAYRNLTTYLTPNATYMDAYYGSLQAAQDLYGNPSVQYNAVRQAWYAVGIGNDPNNFCSGTTSLIAPSGTVTDGSGTANYNNNANCKWVIAPPGATQISLNFTSFDTEADYDTVFVYDGPDESFPILAIWWGNTLPAVINTTPGAGAMCIRFSSDVSNVGAGWSANYTSIGVNPSCDGGTIMASPSGTFNDGSSGGNYGNNQLCYWFIAPPCATSVTLSFSQFNTELDYDGIIVYDDLAGTNLLGVYTGTSIPGVITSSTGKMLVVFVSDYSTTLQGFTANYTSSGSAYCTGTTTLNTADNGSINDGSGSNNYCNNQDCMWLIQPPQATSITLNFTSFDLEQASSDGQTIYDAVAIYDGNNTSAPLLGTYTGNNLPPAITSTSGSMLVRFYSDIEETKQGWSANYTSTQNSYCSGNISLTAPSGNFSDGSNTNDYANNSDCSWLIQPSNASSITLTFSAFNTELNNDGVIIYDGANNSSPVLGQFSGSSIPPTVTSTGGSMYVEFLSNPSQRGQGWIANYTSTTAVSIGETFLKSNFNIYPNPTEGIFTMNSSIQSPVTMEITDILGRKVLNNFIIKEGTNRIDASELTKGVYLMKIICGENYFTERIIIK